MQEKLYEWILRQHENGLRLTVADIATHIQVSLHSSLFILLSILKKELVRVKFWSKKLEILPFHTSCKLLKYAISVAGC
jgi:hypothetical protein